MKSSLKLVILFKVFEGVVVFELVFKPFVPEFEGPSIFRIGITAVRVFSGNGTNVERVRALWNLLIDWIYLIADSLIPDLKTA